MTAEIPGRGLRPVGTAIYYLLAEGQVSRIHRLRSDEVWHHYAGDDLLLHLFPAEGDYRMVRLGSGGQRGASPQAMVPAGCWFGAAPAGPQGWVLTGCTMAPGFAFADFELGRRRDLLARCPEQAALIERLTTEEA